MSDKKPDFSNVKSSVASAPLPAEAPLPAAAPPEAPAVQSYTVAKGDTLSKIAKKFYGNANHWKRIHEANKDLIKNPDLIQIGWVLKIPN